MRVSTGMIFDGGTQNILGNQSVLFKTQNQLSTGRRILTPADDPVASAQVLLTTQSQSVNKQFMENQANARDQLKLVEGNLDGLTNLLQEVRERSVQLGNASLTDKERAFIQSEFRSRFEDLVAIGNQQNGAGQYMFSGFQGSVKPFGINPAGVAPGSSSGIPSYNANNPIVSYFGDQGERLLQVEASRHLGTTVSGEDTFMRIKNGNGEFFVTTPTSPLPPALPVTPNAGTAIADQGSVLDVSKWNATPAVMQPQNFEIRFQIDQSVVPAKTYYHLFDVTSNASMMPGAPSDPGTWAAVAINPRVIRLGDLTA